MKNFTTVRFLLLLFGLSCSIAMSAQSIDPQEVALDYVAKHFAEWNLDKADVADLHVTDVITDRVTGKSNVYLTQRHKGIEIYNALINVGVSKDGKASHINHSLIDQVATRVTTTTPSLSPQDAVQTVVGELGGAVSRSLVVKDQPKANVYVFDKSNISVDDVKVKLTYQPIDGQLHLAWMLDISRPGDTDYWSMRVDANSGKIIDRNNYTVYCSFDAHENHEHNIACKATPTVGRTYGLKAVKGYKSQKKTTTTTTANDGSSYLVFPVPVESPIHGDQALVNEPFDTISSPFGWHDIDGVAGAEFTITRGNNVHAFNDRAGSFSPNSNTEGGVDLDFNFPYDPDLEPEDLVDASVTNLFYMNNILHDFSYAYGFTEDCGNFQENNYGNPGVGNDYVNALAQFGAADTTGTFRNNANFATPADGGSGRMRMYVWDSNPAADYAFVVSPAQVAGSYPSQPAAFGGTITSTPITGDVVLVEDARVPVTDGCEAFNNADDMDGKIVMIDRGTCEFGRKALRAQEAGAIGVVICNFEDATISMGGGAVGAQVTIPLLMMHNSDCIQLRAFIDQGGLTMTFQAPSGGTGPNLVTSDFDNGIIAHEYAHGISNRLVGGPSNTGCLGSSEQMGEGWSDFFTLITSVKPGDTGPMPRGIGNYATRDRPNGGGIRVLPYSTDFSINNHTYSDVFTNEQVHFVGEVWCTMLWDMYWAFVDEYGFDEDLYYGTGGNNMAIQLVMDGMKNLGCNPGMVNGRDAILQADIDRYGGANQLMIWEVFARRGVGFGADQGINDTNSDNTEDFNIPPLLIEELKLTKSAPELIDAGDDVEVTFTILNHKTEAVTGLVLNDQLPDGAIYQSISDDNITVTQNGNDLSFEIRDLVSIDTVTFSYIYSTPDDKFSIRQYYDDMEDEYNTTYFWAPFAFPDPSTSINNPFIWADDLIANSGVAAWAVGAPAEESRLALIGSEVFTVTGTQPVLRFYHNYNTEPGVDGGTIEITTDPDPFNANWERIGDKIFRNPYSGLIQYGTFVIPFYETFWGNSNGFVASYIDLSDYIGQDIFVRFHYATDANNDSGPGGYLGWFIDDFEMMDMVNYDTEACISSNEGDQVCDNVDGRGTVVESQDVQTSTDDLTKDVSLEVFPNPADDFLYVYVSSEQVKDATISLTGLDGRMVLNKAVEINSATQTFTLDTEALPAGFYFVTVQTNSGNTVQKVVIR